MKARRLLSVCVALVLLATVSVAAASAPLASTCMSGGAYDPACDVDDNSNIYSVVIQLPAGHSGQTCSYDISPAMVPKTGHTTSFAAGDDGDLQKGVAWPNPRSTDNGNGPVTDNLTGLIWLKNANCFGLRVWATALTDDNTVNNRECGLTDGSVEGDWRLPNVREMQSLIDYGRYNPALPSGYPFTGAQSEYYWTSSTYPDSTYAWIMYLGNGSVGLIDKTPTFYVWPVRGGQ